MENIAGILAGMLTTKQVAERLGVSIQKVHRLMLYRRIEPAFKLDGKTGRYYFRVEDVDALAEKLAAGEANEAAS